MISTECLWLVLSFKMGFSFRACLAVLSFHETGCVALGLPALTC